MLVNISRCGLVRRLGTFDSIAKHGYEAIGDSEPAIVRLGPFFSTNPALDLLASQFEQPTLRASFGYGSGVVAQAGYLGIKPQIDMIHIVDSALAFHSENFKKNRAHYSGLRVFGPNAISSVQALGAGVYFNPYVQMTGSSGAASMVKYGVVTQETVLRDLCEWNTMYLAGRLQKPVQHFVSTTKLQHAIAYNLQSALNVSLMLMDGKRGLAVSAIFEKIASLSYLGDPRMAVGGENPNKVSNIVAKQSGAFKLLYAAALENAMAGGYLVKEANGFGVLLNERHKMAILQELPLQFRRRVLASLWKKHGGKDTDPVYSFLQGRSPDLLYGECLERASKSRRLKLSLSLAMLSTIAWPALVQTFKGIFTAGIVKSMRYAWEKRSKSR